MTNQEILSELQDLLEQIYTAQNDAADRRDWNRRDELADIASGIRLTIHYTKAI